MPVKIYEVKILKVDNPRSIYLHNADEAVKMVDYQIDEKGNPLPVNALLSVSVLDLYMTGELEMMKQKQQNDNQ